MENLTYIYLLNNTFYNSCNEWYLVPPVQIKGLSLEILSFFPLHYNQMIYKILLHVYSIPILQVLFYLIHLTENNQIYTLLYFLIILFLVFVVKQILFQYNRNHLFQKWYILLLIYHQ